MRIDADSASVHVRAYLHTYLSISSSSPSAYHQRGCVQLLRVCVSPSAAKHEIPCAADALWSYRWWGTVAKWLLESRRVVMADIVWT